MKNNLITLLVLFLYSFVSAQTNVKQYEFKEGSSGMFRTKLLGVNNDYVFIGYTKKSFEPTMTVLQYSKDFTYKNQLSTRIITKLDDIEFVSFQVLGESLYLFTKNIDRKNRQVNMYYQPVDPESFTTIGEPVKIYECNYPSVSKFSLEFDQIESTNIAMSNSFKFHLGQTCLYITGDIFDYDKKKYSTQVICLSKDRKVKWNKSFPLQFHSSKNVFVDKHNDLNIVSQEITQSQTAKDILFTKINQEGVSRSTSKISMKGMSLSCPYFGENEKGNLVFSVLYSKQVSNTPSEILSLPLFSVDHFQKQMSGVLFYEVNFETSEALVSNKVKFSESFLSEINRQDDLADQSKANSSYSYNESKYLIKEESSSFAFYPTNFTSSIVTDDGVLLVVDQYRFENLFNTYRKIILIKINKAGEILWTKTIKRFQVDSGLVDSKYSGYETFIQNNKLHVIFNNTIKNKVESNEKLAVYYGGKSNSYIEDVQINLTTGKSERASFNSNENEILVPLSNPFVSKSTYFVVEEKSKFKIFEVESR